MVDSLRSLLLCVPGNSETANMTMTEVISSFGQLAESTTGVSAKAFVEGVLQDGRLGPRCGVQSVYLNN